MGPREIEPLQGLVEEEEPVKGNLKLVLLEEEGRPEELGVGVTKEPRQESF